MTPRRRVGVKDVAALAGTSVASVSRVLSGKGYASAGMRARVMDAARELEYQPNLRARALRQRSSYTVGLIIPNLLNAYYTALANSASLLLADAGYKLLLASTRDNAELEKDIVHEMIGHDVAGLIWVPTAPSQGLLDYFQNQHVPAVSLIRRIPQDRIDTVVFEDFKGSYAATQHLIDLGHRGIGYIGGDEKHSSNFARWQGYVAAMRDAGLPMDDGLVKLGTPSSDWGEAAAASLLGLGHPPTAIFVASNAIMSGLMKAVRQHSVAVPDELSLICFDDVDWFTFSVPPITAISISYDRLAELTVDLLLRRIKSPEDSKKAPAFLEISFELIVRNSTAPPRRDSCD